MYHSPEYPENCSLQWLGEEICIYFSCLAEFQWQVPVLNTILNKEVSHSDVIFMLRAWILLSWWNSISSTAYPFPSINYLYHSHCGKAPYSPTISASVGLFPLIFYFHDISFIDPDPMDIIAPVCPLQSRCVAKDVFTHHLMKLRFLDLSTSGRYRVPMMYLRTLTIVPR